MTDIRRCHLRLMKAEEIDRGFQWGTVSEEERAWWWEDYEKELLHQFSPRVKFNTTTDTTTYKGESYE